MYSVLRSNHVVGCHPPCFRNGFALISLEDPIPAPQWKNQSSPFFDKIYTRCKCQGTNIINLVEYVKIRENYGGVLGKFSIFREIFSLHRGVILVNGCRGAGRTCLGRKDKCTLNGWRRKVEENKEKKTHER